MCKKESIKKHDIVQIANLEHNWLGCLVYVSDTKSWGIEGFVEIPLKGKAYIRLGYDDIEFIGTAYVKLREVNNNEN